MIVRYISTIENKNIKEMSKEISKLWGTRVTELVQKTQFHKKHLTLQGLEQEFMKILLYMNSPLTEKQSWNSPIVKSNLYKKDQ